jgi:hypothetical protein
MIHRSPVLCTIPKKAKVVWAEETMRRNKRPDLPSPAHDEGGALRQELGNAAAQGTAEGCGGCHQSAPKRNMSQLID